MKFSSETRLSKHFRLRELEKSQVALRNGIDNTVQDETIFNNLKSLCGEILEPIRNNFGKPFSPNSGYRCLELNRKLGSRDTSQHTLGQAVDIELPGIDNEELLYYIKEKLDYDQIILEYYDGIDPHSGWVHVSYVSPEENRRNSFSYDGKTYRVIE